MPSTGDIRRMRVRRKERQRGLRNLASTSSILLALLAILLGLVGLGLSIGYAELQRGLPAVDELQGIFNASGGELLAPTRFYDRTGEVAVQDLLHPLAADRVWFHLPSDSGTHAYQNIAATTVAAQDASFWSNPGYQLSHVLSVVTDDSAGNGTGYEGSQPQKSQEDGKSQVFMG